MTRRMAPPRWSTWSSLRVTSRSSAGWTRRILRRRWMSSRMSRSRKLSRRSRMGRQRRSEDYAQSSISLSKTTRDIPLQLGGWWALNRERPCPDGRYAARAVHPTLGAPAHARLARQITVPTGTQTAHCTILYMLVFPPKIWVNSLFAFGACAAILLFLISIRALNIFRLRLIE